MGTLALQIWLAGFYCRIGACCRQWTTLAGGQLEIHKITRRRAAISTTQHQSELDELKIHVHGCARLVLHVEALPGCSRVVQRTDGRWKNILGKCCMSMRFDDCKEERRKTRKGVTVVVRGCTRRNAACHHCLPSFLPLHWIHIHTTLNQLFSMHSQLLVLAECPLKRPSTFVRFLKFEQYFALVKHSENFFCSACHVEGTLYPSISLLEIGRHIMPTPQGCEGNYAYL